VTRKVCKQVPVCVPCCPWWWMGMGKGGGAIPRRFCMR